MISNHKPPQNKQTKQPKPDNVVWHVSSISNKDQNKNKRNTETVARLWKQSLRVSQMDPDRLTKRNNLSEII